MDRQSLLYASAGIAVLALLTGILTFSGGGLNPQTQAALATADQLLNTSRANHGELSQEARSPARRHDRTAPVPAGAVGWPDWTNRKRTWNPPPTSWSRPRNWPPRTTMNCGWRSSDASTRPGGSGPRRCRPTSEILDAARTVGEVDKKSAAATSGRPVPAIAKSPPTAPPASPAPGEP